MRRAVVRTLLAAGAVVIVVVGGMVALTMMSISGDADDDQGTSLCASTLVGVGAAEDLDSDQLADANTIIAVGRQLGVPDRAVVVALATAMQESSLENLPDGDRDSVGLFQQRPSQGWGTADELRTPQIAAQRFYTALLAVPGWASMPLTDAAQSVQRSAYPLAYARWEGFATALLTAAGGGGGSVPCDATIGFPTTSTTVGAMLDAALGQQGKPYVWGATGPDAFDCSGLVVYAWQQAGYQLSVRTSEQMYAVSDPVTSGEEQPGDLVFGDFGPDGPGHVMIVVRPGLAVEAPHTGDVVKVVSYRTGPGWTLGRLRAGVLSPLPSD